jgi:hypothetical protein
MRRFFMVTGLTIALIAAIAQVGQDREAPRVHYETAKSAIEAAPSLSDDANIQIARSAEFHLSRAEVKRQWQEAKLWADAVVWVEAVKAQEQAELEAIEAELAAVEAEIAEQSTAGVDTSYHAGASGYPGGWEPGFINGYPCGGDLPPCYVMARESGGNPSAVNWGGCSGTNCYGLWQFGGFWDCKLGQPCGIASWTVEQQNAAARTLWAGGSGCGNWDAC